VYDIYTTHLKRLENRELVIDEDRRTGNCLANTRTLQDSTLLPAPAKTAGLWHSGAQSSQNALGAPL